ncbi:hypothetical protein LY76DRAFT_412096 [Colletotrichum caudatum]|nr:hypothetical protein LY76DRAFT_412096 [Colletotrichum caudatum]
MLKYVAGYPQRATCLLINSLVPVSLPKPAAHGQEANCGAAPADSTVGTMLQPGSQRFHFRSSPGNGTRSEGQQRRHTNPAPSLHPHHQKFTTPSQRRIIPTTLNLLGESFLRGPRLVSSHQFVPASSIACRLLPGRLVFPHMICF